MADDANPRAVIGDNGGPTADPFAALTAHLEDLLVEAHAWADGTTVETQAQADEASRLIDDLNKAAKAADELRVAEKAPLDAAIAEIQARFNVYIADRKNKQPGKLWRAVDALKASVLPFLQRQEAERQAAAAKARQEAEEAAQRAADAARAASASDLAAQEAAEALVADARQAEADARVVEKARPQARGGERAMGLRTVYRATMTSRREALNHYAATRTDDLVAFLQRLADADVRDGKRALPGFDVTAEQVL